MPLKALSRFLKSNSTPIESSGPILKLSTLIFFVQLLTKASVPLIRDEQTFHDISPKLDPVRPHPLHHLVDYLLHCVRIFIIQQTTLPVGSGQTVSDSDRPGLLTDPFTPSPASAAVPISTGPTGIEEPSALSSHSPATELAIPPMVSGYFSPNGFYLGPDFRLTWWAYLTPGLLGGDLDAVAVVNNSGALSGRQRIGCTVGESSGRPGMLSKLEDILPLSADVRTGAASGVTTAGLKLMHPLAHTSSWARCPSVAGKVPASLSVNLFAVLLNLCLSPISSSSVDSGAWRIDWRLLLGDSLWSLGRYSDALAAYLEAGLASTAGFVRPVHPVSIYSGTVSLNSAISL
ncbi:unnamed protein product [Protopolystoma xenopodis]|uniref:Uncharacterized protein n=1 Tax=Protopolystoma xenopodis TaxID=117903 RepID=A0A448WI32_9PLAT|nr:unnamed protein product [Protopolystoma xenopodis]